jgi:probable F420-dependent oxidoreductase
VAEVPSDGGDYRGQLKVDVLFAPPDWREGFGVGDFARFGREVEALGYDAIFTGEAGIDPFLPLALAAEHTRRIQVGTSIAVAVARSPVVTAQVAHDLNELSGGRFILGLGSQVRAHIERRYGIPWRDPGARMRDYVLAVRAIWRAWDVGEHLAYEGPFTSHTLMTPYFSPRPSEHGTPPIFVAALGPKMTGVAGEVCDGLLLHPMATEAFVRDVVSPALDAGLARAGRQRSDIEVARTIFVGTGKNDAELQAARAGVRDRIGFYGATPAYKAVFAMHGLEGLQRRLNERAREGRWTELSELVPDDVVDDFAVCGPIEEIGPRLLDRSAHFMDRVRLYAPVQPAAEVWLPVLEHLRASTRAAPT